MNKLKKFTAQEMSDNEQIALHCKQERAKGLAVKAKMHLDCMEIAMKTAEQLDPSTRELHQKWLCELACKFFAIALAIGLSACATTSNFAYQKDGVDLETAKRDHFYCLRMQKGVPDNYDYCMRERGYEWKVRQGGTLIQ